MIVFGQSVARWVSEGLGYEREYNNCTAIGRQSDKMLGAAVFHNWEPDYGTIELSIYSEDRRWLTRGLLRVFADYVFNTCGCQMVIMRTEANHPALSIIRRLGGDFHVIPRLRGRTRDGVIATITKEQWEKFNGW